MENMGPVVIVSGGSRGLGIEICTSILKRGVNVASFARNETKETSILRKEYGDKFFFKSVDITNHTEIGNFVRDVSKQYGEISGLVNNAAIGQDHLLIHISAENISKIIEINLTSTIILTRFVVKKMILAGNGGRIINISSICGAKGYTGLSVYSATKAGLDGFTRALARELGSRNILVNSIAPGFFASEMSSVLAPEQLATITRRTSTQKLVEPHNLLPVVDLLLFSDTNMTGQVLPIDGGV